MKFAQPHCVTHFELLIETTLCMDDPAAIINEPAAMARQKRSIVVAGMRRDGCDTLHSMGLLDRGRAENFA